MHQIAQMKKLTVFLLCALTLVAGCAGSPKQASTGEYIDDSVITTKVKAELFKQKWFKSLVVSVETYKGTVQLSGFVDSEEQRQQAELVARSIRGVVDVKNSLIVK